MSKRKKPDSGRSKSKQSISLSGSSKRKKAEDFEEKRKNVKKISRAESLEFAYKVIDDIMEKRYLYWNWPFLEPVDEKALGITDYYQIITNPIDLGTIKRKLEEKQYLTAQEVADDFDLMMRNCFKYNAPIHDVYKKGKFLQNLFKSKWKQLPPIDDEPEEENIEYATVNEPEDEIGPIPGDLTTELAPVVEPIVEHIDETNDNDGELLENAIKQITAAIDLFKTKSDELNKMSKQLLDLKINRLEAKLNGNNYQVPTDVFIDAYNTLSSLANFDSQIRLITSQTPLMQKYTSESPLLNDTPISKFIKQEIDFTPKIPPIFSLSEQRAARYPAISRNHHKKFNLYKPWREQFDFDSEDENANIPMTYEEMKGLSLKIKALNYYQLKVIIKIIESGGYIVEKEQEFEVDFESLSPKILRELDAFVHSLKNDNKKTVCKTPSEYSFRKRELEDQLKKLGVTLRKESTSKNDSSKNVTVPQQNDSSSMATLSAQTSSSSGTDSSESDLASQNQLIANSSIAMVAEVKPTIPKSNPVISSGIGESILDQLLPHEVKLKPQNAKFLSNQEKMQLKNVKQECCDEIPIDDEMKQIENDQSSIVMRTPTPCKLENPPTEEEIRILRQQEQERLQREREMDVDFTSQMEMMNNFESNF